MYVYRRVISKHLFFFETVSFCAISYFVDYRNMPQEKRVRFNEVALEYNGREFVSVRPVPLLPGDDDDDYEDDIMYEQFIMNMQEQEIFRKFFNSPKHFRS